MRVNAGLFWILTAFFVFEAILYTVWGLLYYGKVEWVGAVALTLSAVFSLMIAFYVNRSHRAQAGELPEDRVDGNIDDGDPELGHFSPWSWWPLLLAGSAFLVFLGLAIAIWIAFIGFALGAICLVGWVFEYYRGAFAR